MKRREGKGRLIGVNLSEALVEGQSSDLRG